MHYCFDIDGTICTNRDTMRKERNDPSIEYTDVEPFMAVSYTHLTLPQILLV